MMFFFDRENIKCRLCGTPMSQDAPTGGRTGWWEERPTCKHEYIYLCPDCRHKPAAKDIKCSVCACNCFYT